ncbi:YgjV family protein [Polaribacter cellanae]|uniref:YgjV family protein n=1 Tax=Polaribacter cellanae TaxID=2818493 RepID=A0A975CP88_9FLAO|nr:YgjV family protein [Polaribacter cellanae]QTE22840.1 YgjV family protein [Polaribacter cellanae]
MEEINWIEILGYIASLFIAVSITMESVVKLRIINFIGAILLGTYGVFIESMPIILVNYFIGITNVYYLWKHFKNNKNQTIKNRK